MSVVSDSLQPQGLKTTRLLCPWNFPGKSTGVGCHLLLQGIFPTQGSNLSLLHWVFMKQGETRRILYGLSYQKAGMCQRLFMHFCFCCNKFPPVSYSLHISKGREKLIVLLWLKTKTSVLLHLTNISCLAHGPVYLLRQYEWNHRVFVLLWLAYFTSQNVHQVHSLFVFVFQSLEGKERSFTICPNSLPTYDFANDFYQPILMQVSSWHLAGFNAHLFLPNYLERSN